MEVNQQLSGFLANFDDCLFKLLPDTKAPGVIKDLNKCRTLEECLALNDEYPSGLYFTPNGRFGLVNKIGEQIQFNKNVISEQAWVCSFVLDFDVKDYNDMNMDQLYDMIMDKVVHTNIKPKYIIQSGGGYHVYWIIKKADRQLAFDTYGRDLLKISAQLQKDWGGDKGARVSSNPCALIRLPFSNHWKTGTKLPVNIIWEQDNEVTLKDIDNSIKHLSSLEEAHKNINKTQLKLGVLKYKEIDDIPMPILLEKLKSYPRHIDGDIQTMGIEGTQVVIYSEKQGTLKRNSYKYWKSENKIKCFYDGPLEITPIGKGYQFLYWYFLRDGKIISEFLRKECGIDIHSKETGLGSVNKRMDVGDYTIVLCEGGVVLEAEKSDKKGGTIITTTVLFRNKLDILGKGYTKIKNIGESDVPIRVYIVQIDGVEQLLQLSDSKKTHNRNYKNLWFYGQDNDLGLFFNALDKSPDIEEKIIYDLSGYYNGDVIIGQNVIIGEQDDSYILNKNNVEMTKAKQITVAEYLDKFLQLYKPEMAIPVFLQTLALAGMNLWQGLEIYPALLVSGTTGTGKSAIMRNMKTMIGYAAESRVYSLPNTSPQPLKTYAGDYSVLFLEELTNNINPLSEELIRNIANRNRASRGEIDGNIQFPLRSPLFIVGERTFKGESINNRFVTIMLATKFRQPKAKKLVNELNKFTAYENIYNVLASYKSEDLSSMVQAYANKLNNDGFNARMADARSFMFVMNDIFNLNIPYEDIKGYAISHLNRIGLGEKSQINYRDALRNTLARLGATRSIILGVSDIDHDKYTEFEIVFLNSESYERERGLLNMAIQEINDELGEDIFKMGNESLIFRLSNIRENNKFKDKNTVIVGDWFSKTLPMIPMHARATFTSTYRG